MPREAPAAHLLRRATSALESAAAGLIDLRPGALDRVLRNLQNAAATLRNVMSAGIPAEDKSAVAPAVASLKQRLETARTLTAGLQPFLGTRGIGGSGGYTADGEAEAVTAAASLVCEV